MIWRLESASAYKKKAGSNHIFGGFVENRDFWGLGVMRNPEVVSIGFALKFHSVYLTFLFSMD